MLFRAWWNFANFSIAEEISRLQTAFSGVVETFPDMTTVFTSLHQYCMNKATFDEIDFKRTLTGILGTTINTNCFKLNLPFQFVGQASRSATILFATAVQCIINRPEGSKPIETLVMGHMSDTTLLDIYQNPMDLQNTIRVFKPLKHLIISLKRQEASRASQMKFAAGLWRIITEATHLESLCLIGWNSKRSTFRRKHESGFDGDSDNWRMRCLPYRELDNGSRNLKHLTCLELKRVDVEADALLKMIRNCSASLKELYLNEVYLKIHETEAFSLWIGHGPEIHKPQEEIWIATELRAMPGLKLTILRATALGYDEYTSTPDIDNVHEFDLDDPSGQHRSFDERFVETARGQLPSATIITKPKKDYDVDTFQDYHNTTSLWKSSIDGIFYNNNERALDELKNIISIVERGMSLLTSEIERINTATRSDASENRVVSTD